MASALPLLFLKNHKKRYPQEKTYPHVASAQLLSTAPFSVLLPTQPDSTDHIHAICICKYSSSSFFFFFNIFVLICLNIYTEIWDIKRTASRTAVTCWQFGSPSNRSSQRWRERDKLPSRTCAGRVAPLTWEEPKNSRNLWRLVQSYFDDLMPPDTQVVATCSGSCKAALMISCRHKGRLLQLLFRVSGYIYIYMCG